MLATSVLSALALFSGLASALPHGNAFANRRRHQHDHAARKYYGSNATDNAWDLYNATLQTIANQTHNNATVILDSLNTTTVLNNSICVPLIAANTTAFFQGFNWTIANVTGANLTAGNYSLGGNLTYIADNQTAAVNVTCFSNGTIANVTAANVTYLYALNASYFVPTPSYAYSAVYAAATTTTTTSSSADDDYTYSAEPTTTTSSSYSAAQAEDYYYYQESSSSSSEYVAPTTSTSQYVAPTTTSTSEYVAPTTSTSEYVAPTTSTSEYVAPTTSTSVYVAPTSTAEAVQAAAVTTTAASSSSSSSSSTETGDLTYYATGLGSCGVTSSDTDMMVAVSEDFYDSYPGYDGVNPNANPLCNKKISATLGSNTVTLTVLDRCTGCSYASIDVSPTAFEALTNGMTLNSNTGLGIGRASGVTWSVL